ncbi:MAG: sigma-54-dependent Fis family transcriptional regulator [Dongiaceae bacterium]
MSDMAHVQRVMSSMHMRGAARGDGREPPLVVRSWQRCVAKYGLEPHRTPPPTVLTHSEVADRRAPVADLIGVARGEIDRLFSRIGGRDYVILLTDATGITVDYRCSDKLLSGARGHGLYIGSIWAETQQGTNGVGTCLQEHRPLSIVMGDHFSVRNTTLTCTVAPVFGAEGELVGILDVSTARPTDHGSQAIMREIVTAATRRIENLYFGHRHAARMILRLSRYGTFSDIATEVRLAVDERGRIVEVGNRVHSWLAPALNNAQCGGQPASDLVGRSIEQVLGVTFDQLLAADAPLRVDLAGGKAVYAKFADIDAPTHLSQAAPVASDVSIGAANLGPRAPSASDAVAAPRERPIGGRTRAAIAKDVRAKDIPEYDLDALVGGDATMLVNVDIARRILDRGLPILLRGETGCGKGLFARALHNASRRAGRPFVAVNCAAIPHELIESELFGYRPGAFTGAATAGFKGRLVEADGGTLFLDEIGDMPLSLQTRLLQVLSEQEFTPVGATQPVSIDIAIISATLHDLPKQVREGQFRQDLFFRLSGATLALPALRQRTDRTALVRAIVAEEAARAGCTVVVGDETMRMLAAYDWPGNLRELRHAARFAVALAMESTDGSAARGAPALLLPRHLPPELHRPGNAGAAEDIVEARMIRVALTRTGWNVTATAALLDISRATLHRKIRRYGLHRE